MPAQRRNLITLLNENHPEIKILQECNNVDEGIEAVVKYHPEIVFLDVEMPGKTGFDFVAELNDAAYDLNIIFTTAYEHYALRAIKASALDFIVKPVNEKDLNEALSRFEKKRTKDQVAKQIQVLLQQQDNNPDKKSALPSLTGYVFVRVSDIIRCESENVYTTFFMTDQSKKVVSKTMKDCEELLTDYDFFRVHNSHLINLRHIQEYIKGEGGIAKMDDGAEIEVSRRKKEEFLQRLKRL